MTCDRIAVFMNLHVLKEKNSQSFYFTLHFEQFLSISKKLFFILSLFEFRVNVENNAIHVIWSNFC